MGKKKEEKEKKEEELESSEDSESEEEQVDDSGEEEEVEEETISFAPQTGQNTRHEEGDEDDEENGEDEGEGETEENGNSDLNVEFDFCDPKEEDFLMVKNLLNQGGNGNVQGMDKHLSQLTEDICEQGACGTTVCVDGDVFAFVSALSKESYKEKSYFETLEKALQEHCPSECEKQLRQLWEGKFAWLISERLVNMPNEVVPQMHLSINEDREWAANHVEETGGTSDMFDVDHYLFIAPFYSQEEQIQMAQESDADDSEDEEEADKDELEAGKKRKRKDSSSKGNKKQKGEDTRDAILCQYFEQQVLLKQAVLQFPIPLATKNVKVGKAKGAIPQRHKPKQAMAAFIPVNKHKSSVEEMKKILG